MWRSSGGYNTAWASRYSVVVREAIQSSIDRVSRGCR